MQELRKQVQAGLVRHQRPLANVKTLKTRTAATKVRQTTEYNQQRLLIPTVN